jgi:hypothetical protein
MILKNKYERAIEHIEVTAEMHDKIMKNLGEIDSVKRQSKAPFFKIYRKFIPIAACFALILVGTFLVYNNLTNTDNPPVATNNSIADCSSLGELSDAVGFKVREVNTFPFIVQQTTYALFWGKTAQISYIGGDNALVFRMSAGSEDNSGNYNDYGEVKNNSAGDYTVTIKGDNGQYYLAVWEYGGYSYSINIPNGVSEDEILKIVLSVR